MSRGQVKNATRDSFFTWEGDVLGLNVLGKPSAARDAIGKSKGTQLKISVTAAPKKLPAVYAQAALLPDDH